MDFPLFDLEFFGNRLLIAWVAILHILINHPMAVGASLYIARLEAQGHTLGDPRWDEVAYRMLFVCFVITTTVGALTGVGIWLTTALVNPDAIGSLLRVFFWAWFTEWLVFITEVVLILSYFLTWKKWTGANKAKHIRLGYALAAFSWITMALITAILGFMMDPGAWQKSHALVDGVFNPIYLPQLAFRTFAALAMAGGMGLAMTLIFTPRGSDLRTGIVRFSCRWIAVWSVPLAASAVWYLKVVPAEMLSRAPTAILTMRFEAFYPYALGIIVALLAATAYVAVTGWRWPRQVPRWGLVLPLIAFLVLLAVFERTREFVRKPWIIGGYMYANGIRAEDYPMYQAEGLLALHPYASIHVITDANRVQAGHAVFRIACATCHTSAADGVNSVHAKFENMLGKGPWKASGLNQIIATMHGSRAYMPPFPGTVAERRALAEWLVELHRIYRPEPATTTSPAATKAP